MKYRQRESVLGNVYLLFKKILLVWLFYQRKKNTPILSLIQSPLTLFQISSPYYLPSFIERSETYPSHKCVLFRSSGSDFCTFHCAGQVTECNNFSFLLSMNLSFIITCGTQSPNPKFQNPASGLNVLISFNSHTLLKRFTINLDKQQASL